MKMLFKQRLFSWLDSYEIYDEEGAVLFEVRSKLAWGHCLKIYDKHGNEVGTVKERVFTFLPVFEMYINDNYFGCIKKEFTFFIPKYYLECNDWSIDGDFFEWDYSINDSSGSEIAVISKQIWNLTDTYVIDVNDSKNALMTLMVVLAIDAEKCSRND